MNDLLAKLAVAVGGGLLGGMVGGYFTFLLQKWSARGQAPPGSIGEGFGQAILFLLGMAVGAVIGGVMGGGVALRLMILGNPRIAMILAFLGYVSGVPWIVYWVVKISRS
jgi:hypothetical protein